MLVMYSTSTFVLEFWKFISLTKSSCTISVSLYAKSEDIDPVSGYGVSVMYQCRGDLTLPDCATCVKTAFGTIPNSTCLVSSFRQVNVFRHFFV